MMNQLKKHSVIKIQDDVYIVSKCSKSSVSLLPVSDILNDIHTELIPIIRINPDRMKEFELLDRSILLFLMAIDNPVIELAVKDYFRNG